MRLSAREMGKNTIWALVLALGIGLYFRRTTGQLRLPDGLLLSGVFFVCMGLFRLTRKLELYHSTIYGAKRLWRGVTGRGDGQPLGSYQEFLESNPYNRPYGELLLVGAGFFAASWLLALV